MHWLYVRISELAASSSLTAPEGHVRYRNMNRRDTDDKGQLFLLRDAVQMPYVLRQFCPSISVRPVFMYCAKMTNMWCSCSVKTVWSMPERFRGELLTMGCYTNPSSFPFLNTFSPPSSPNNSFLVPIMTLFRRRNHRGRVVFGSGRGTFFSRPLQPPLPLRMHQNAPFQE